MVWSGFASFFRSELPHPQFSFGGSGRTGWLEEPLGYEEVILVIVILARLIWTKVSLPFLVIVGILLLDPSFSAQSSLVQLSNPHSFFLPLASTILFHFSLDNLAQRS